MFSSHKKDIFFPRGQQQEGNVLERPGESGEGEMSSCGEAIKLQASISSQEAAEVPAALLAPPPLRFVQKHTSSRDR